MNRLLLAALIATFMLVTVIQMARSEDGIASVYGNENGQGRRADGRRYRPMEIGCAHRTRHLGSVVRITNLRTGRTISCAINDRGPFVHGRIIDLSIGAARALGIRGLARVRVAP